MISFLGGLDGLGGSVATTLIDRAGLTGLTFLTDLLLALVGVDNFRDDLESRVTSPSIDLFGFIIYNYNIWQ
jgi:hypothetical protein